MTIFVICCEAQTLIYIANKKIRYTNKYRINFIKMNLTLKYAYSIVVSLKIKFQLLFRKITSNFTFGNYGETQFL
jgi:hypothetical protein